MERGPAREAVAAGQQVGTHGGGVESGSRAKKLAETARAQDTKALSPGLEFPRYFTLAGVDPFDEVECGRFYARALASYGLLHALSGAR